MKKEGGKLKKAMSDQIETAKAKAESAREEAKKKLAEGVEKISETRNNWEELMHKIEVGRHVKKELEDLYENFDQMEISDVVEKFKGVFVIGFLGMLMNKEEFDTWKEERKGLNLNVGPLETDQSEIENQQLRGMLKQNGKPRKPETKGEAIKKEHYANMNPQTRADYDVWFERNGVKVKRGTPGAKRKWALKKKPKHEPQDIPSEYALKYGSGKLLEKKPNSPEELVKITIAKIFPHTKNPEQARKNAINFLAGCALGRFQILPSANFSLLGWSSKGEEGLKNIYRFLKEPQRQIDLFEKKIMVSMKKYEGDPITTGIAYYSGGGPARTYLKEKKAGKLMTVLKNGKKQLAYKPGAKKTLTKDQRGGGNILTYANKMYKEYKRSEGMGFSKEQRVAMALEHIESRGRLMNQLYVKDPNKTYRSSFLNS